MSDKAVHIIVHGKVQGVFFRARTKDTAGRLGINGWVRNCEDGSVEIMAVGAEKTLNEFIKWCHRGPERATVTKIMVKEIQPENFSSFEVRN